MVGQSCFYIRASSLRYVLLVGIALITNDSRICKLTIMMYMNCNIEHDRYSIIMAVECENKGCYIMHGELRFVETT